MSTKATQTDGKYHVPPSLSLAYSTIANSLDSSQKNQTAGTKKKQKSPDLMLMLDDIDVSNPQSNANTNQNAKVQNNNNISNNKNGDSTADLKKSANGQNASNTQINASFKTKTKTQSK